MPTDQRLKVGDSPQQDWILQDLPRDGYMEHRRAKCVITGVDSRVASRLQPVGSFSQPQICVRRVACDDG
jgi:hypothetical protein